jgi:hypothetical protein
MGVPTAFTQSVLPSAARPFAAVTQNGRNPTVLFIYSDGRTIVQQVNPQASDVAVSHAKGSGDRKHTRKAHATREAPRCGSTVEAR